MADMMSMMTPSASTPAPKKKATRKKAAKKGGAKKAAKKGGAKKAAKRGGAKKGAKRGARKGAKRAAKKGAKRGAKKSAKRGGRKGAKRVAKKGGGHVDYHTTVRGRLLDVAPPQVSGTREADDLVSEHPAARHSRSVTLSPRCGVHDSMTSNVASGFSRVMTTSEMSARNRSPAGSSPAGRARTARPAIFASPGHSASLPSCG